eukprot:2267105-Prymnesium_polylepis.1
MPLWLRLSSCSAESGRKSRVGSVSMPLLERSSIRMAAASAPRMPKSSSSWMRAPMSRSLRSTTPLGANVWRCRCSASSRAIASSESAVAGAPSAARNASTAASASASVASIASISSAIVSSTLS